MARGSRMPERLIEARAALGKDPFIKSLGRATLVDRAARNFSAFDSKIHADARRSAGKIRFRQTRRIVHPCVQRTKSQAPQVTGRRFRKSSAKDPVRDCSRSRKPPEELVQQTTHETLFGHYAEASRDQHRRVVDSLPDLKRATLRSVGQ